MGPGTRPSRAISPACRRSTNSAPPPKDRSVSITLGLTVRQCWEWSPPASTLPPFLLLGVEPIHLRRDLPRNALILSRGYEPVAEPRLVTDWRLDSDNRLAMRISRIPRAEVSRIAFDPTDATGQHVLLSSSIGVFESSDGGSNWTVLRAGAASDLVLFHPGGPPSRVTAVAAFESSGLWTATRQGGGWGAWAQLTGSAFPTTFDRITLGRQRASVARARTTKRAVAARHRSAISPGTLSTNRKAPTPRSANR